MDFFDQFWVPQTDPPEPAHLVVLIGIDIVFLLIYIFSYNLINYQVKRSMRGIAEDAVVEIPQNLLTAFRSIFIGAGLMNLSTIVSRASYFLDVTCPESPLNKPVEDCYAILGQEDFLTVLGIQLISVGLFNLYLELSRELGGKPVKYNPLIVAIGIIFLSILSISISPRESQLIEYLQVVFQMLLYTGLFIFLLIQIILKRKQGKNNPLTKLRKNLVLIAFLFINIGVMVLSAIFIPTPNQSYPTQEPVAEYYISGLSVILAITISIILALVFLPKFLLKLISSDDKDILQYWDIRFDNPHDLDRRVINNERNIMHRGKEQGYVLAYAKNEMLVCEAINRSFEGEIIPFSQRTEETLRQLLLPNVDILYFSSSYSRSIKSQFNRIKREFGKQFQYHRGEITYENIYKFNAPETIYALIIVYPSIYNASKNTWLINFTPAISGQLIHFFNTYSKYIRQTVESQMALKGFFAFAIRFKERNGMTQNVPNHPSDSGIPDKNYIHFFDNRDITI